MASCSMIIGSGCPNDACALRRRPPIADGLPYAAVNVVSRPRCRPRLQPCDPNLRHPRDVSFRSGSPIAAPGCTTNHQIPSRLSFRTASGHAAVSYLEACATPARLVSSCPRTPARQGRHRTTLNKSGPSPSPRNSLHSGRSTPKLDSRTCAPLGRRPALHVAPIYAGPRACDN